MTKIGKMKKITMIVVLALATAMLAGCGSKNLPNRVKRRIERTAQKEAQTLEKEGWKPMHMKNLEWEMMQAYLGDYILTRRLKEEGSDERIVVAEGRAVESERKFAFWNALRAAELDAIDQVEKEIIEQLKREHEQPQVIDSLTGLMEANKKQVAQHVSLFTSSMSQIYRDLPDGKVEVLVRGCGLHNWVYDNLYKVIGRKNERMIKREKEIKEKSDDLKRALDSILKLEE